MLQNSYKAFLLFLFLNPINFSLSAQTNFSIGAFIAPTITHPQNTFYTNNPNNLSLTYGLSFDYAFNKSWSISIRPSYSKQNYFSDCVDTVNYRTIVIATTGSGYEYIVSNSNCRFTRESSESFIVLPIFIKFTFNSHKWEKLKKYILIGNSININIQYKNLIIDNRTKENVTPIGFSRMEGDPTYLFFPSVGTGGEFLLKEKLLVFMDLSMRTLYFRNFTVGLTFGVKANL